MRAYPELATDLQIIAQASSAANGEKFDALWNGNWSNLYPSQSEADQSLVNMLGFYSKNHAQIARLFRQSGLGQRDKAKRDDYVGNMVRKSLDRDLPPIAFEHAFKGAQAASDAQAAGEPVAKDFWSNVPPIEPVWLAPPPIGHNEWYMASASPAAIVAGLYYADVGTFIAPGGTGKTTLMLYILAHIVLGRELWGMPVLKSGPVLFLTAEDSREMLVARLRSICTDLKLTVEEIQQVAQRILISDVSGTGLKLTEVERDVVRPAHKIIEPLVAACRFIAPVMIVIDPAVSFGVGESRVNDAEQGLVEAGRRLRSALNCCVLYIHHTGKLNARDKALDQYAGRGGSSFSDGSRMVHVLQAQSSEDWFKATGVELEAGETGLILARPKMSYTLPQPWLYIRRKGYCFDKVDPITVGKEAASAADDASILGFITDELAAGRYHTKATLEAMEALGFKRGRLRASFARLEAANLLEIRDLPGPTKAKGARTYLHPIATANSMEGGP